MFWSKNITLLHWEKQTITECCKEVSLFVLHTARILHCCDVLYNIFCASPCRSSLTLGITACKILFLKESKCVQERCWYCQDCCECCFKPVATNEVYCSKECYRFISMSTEHGMIMVNIPEGSIKRKYCGNVLLQVVAIEKLAEGSHHHARICDILLCIGKYDTPYILFHQWDPEEQHFVDFFISEFYEPLEPVWKFKFSPQPLLNKLKESGYITKVLMAATRLCTGQSLNFRNFLMTYIKHSQKGYALTSTQAIQLQLVPHLPSLRMRLPIENITCLPRGFRAHRPDSGEKCLIFPNDHQLLFHNYEKHKKGDQVTLTCMNFLIVDPSGKFYFVVLEDKPLHCAFYASCYYVTHNSENDSLSVVKYHSGGRRCGPDEQTAKIKTAQSQLDRIFPKIIRQHGWPSLHALLTRSKLLRWVRISKIPSIQ